MMGPAANKTAAAERAEALRPVFTELAGLSANKAAAELNTCKVSTPTGSPWSPQTIIRVRARLAA
jgi:Recombinase